MLKHQRDSAQLSTMRTILFYPMYPLMQFLMWHHHYVPPKSCQEFLFLLDNYQKYLILQICYPYRLLLLNLLLVFHHIYQKINLHLNLQLRLCHFWNLKNQSTIFRGLHLVEKHTSLWSGNFFLLLFHEQ